MSNAAWSLSDVYRITVQSAFGYTTRFCDGARPTLFLTWFRRGSIK
jgi:hypothetical protein